MANKIVNIESKQKLPKTPNEYAVYRFILKHEPKIFTSVGYDLFTYKVMVKGPLPWYQGAKAFSREWNKFDDMELQRLCQDKGLNVKREHVSNCIELCAKRQEFHPIRQYLEGLKTWDKVERLDTWLINYLNAVGNKTYLAAVGSKFLISAVARVMKPGCKVDTMLILEGKQGIGKSRALQALAANKAYFTDSIESLENKDVYELIRGKWIVEISELDAIKGLKTSRLKQFLSKSVDDYRPPYSVYAVKQNRQCVFAGTTNENEYLRDETGGRRFWPVKCSSEIDAKALESVVDKLWSEAYYKYNREVKWWLDSEELEKLAANEQAKRIERDPWLQKVDDCLFYKLNSQTNIVSIEEVLTDEEVGFGMSINAIGRAERNRIKACAEYLRVYDYARKKDERTNELVSGFIAGDGFIYARQNK